MLLSMIGCPSGRQSPLLCRRFRPSLRDNDFAWAVFVRARTKWPQAEAVAAPGATAPANANLSTLATSAAPAARHERAFTFTQ